MIHSLRLINFKNFKDATLQLGKFTVVVGTNASGKSNLRDAFRLLHGVGRGYSLAELFGEKWGEGGEVQWLGIRGGTREASFRGARTFTLECTFAIPAPEKSDRGSYRIEVDVGSPRKAPRVVAERLAVEGHRDYIYDSHPEGEKLKEADANYLTVQFGKPARGKKSNGRHSIQDRFPSDKPILTQLPTHELAKRDSGILLAAQWALRAFRSMRFPELNSQAMRLPSVPGQVVLGDSGENLSSVLQTLCETAGKKRAVLDWVRELTPLDVEDFEFVADQTGRVLLTLIEMGGQRTSAYSASEGTLRFLAMIAFILGPDPARFYFFEELETGIHPTRLHLLLQLIQQTVRRQEIQVVASTHSPQLLGFLDEPAREAATLAYRLERHNEARLRRIADMHEVRDVLANENLGQLHEGGWFENVVEFLENAEPDVEVHE